MTLAVSWSLASEGFPVCLSHNYLFSCTLTLAHLCVCEFASNRQGKSRQKPGSRVELCPPPCPAFRGVTQTQNVSPHGMASQTSGCKRPETELLTGRVSLANVY